MDDPAAQRLIDRIVATLFEAADDGTTDVHLEWSQAGTQHSGRAFAVLDGHSHWIEVPTALAPDLRELRSLTADRQTGAWLSVTIAAHRGEAARVTPNYDRRPYWNSTGVSMLDVPSAPSMPPIPDQRRWLADLQRYPRERAHLPDWLTPGEVEGEAVAQLRAGLDGLGMPRGGVVLPGESSGGADQPEPLEGVVEVVRYGARHYGVQVADYGQHVLLGEYFTERAACDAVWHYVSPPLPAPLHVAHAELATRVQAAQQGLTELGQRVAAAGPGGIITNLATGVPYDRIGTIDGLYFFVWGTPWEQRSLPVSARGPGAEQQVFVAAREVEVQAEIAPAWFGQPGGGLRFHVEAPARGVRDLVRAGVLQRVVA
ncbi:TNT domain-containing protein [Ruania halotolerans]|uniref:TNT domain-containing protein n=1 Tax=Ruania halotolerans TaxID=2897773 RepID=UPI001E3E8F68|nr:TNT domain-containing protein [Ruania halotolerans]UFU06033.1 TNT domain-containing protein [Ruania halotolerans]